MGGHIFGTGTATRPEPAAPLFLGQESEHL